MTSSAPQRASSRTRRGPLASSSRGGDVGRRGRRRRRSGRRRQSVLGTTIGADERRVALGRDQAPSACVLAGLPRRVACGSSGGQRHVSDPLAPGVGEPEQQDPDEDQHARRARRASRSPEDQRPQVDEHHLDVERDEQQGVDVERRGRTGRGCRRRCRCPTRREPLWPSPRLRWESSQAAPIVRKTNEMPAKANPTTYQIPVTKSSAVDESRRRWEGGPRQRVRGVVNCGPAMCGRRTAILAAGEVRSGSRRSKPAERRELGAGGAGRGRTRGRGSRPSRAGP